MLVLRTIPYKTLKPLQVLLNGAKFISQIPHRNSNQVTAKPSSAYYDDLINKAGREKDFAAVEQLLKQRMRDGFFNTTRTFRFISTDLSELDDLLAVLARLDKGITRKTAYDCLVARLAKMQHPGEAMRVAEIMTREDCRPSATTFHPILDALARKREIDSAWGVIEVMRARKINPDTTSYNHILTAHCFVGDLTSAAGVLKKMDEEKLEADARTYDALVLGACRAGKLDGALAVIRRMVDEGVPPLYSTHAHVIGAMVKGGYYAQAVEFVMGYAGRDKELDTENLGLLASRLINKKRYEEAKLLVREMKNRGLRIIGNHLRDFYELRAKN